MSETLFAFLALLLVIFFAMNQQRDIVETEREIASIELEVMAQAVGQELMHTIAAADFDEATSGGSPQTVTTDDLTPTDEFGDPNGCATVADCEDIDDFHDMNPKSYTFIVDETEEGDELSFDFSIEASVTYIDDDGEETEQRTWIKQVTLIVDQEVEDGARKFLATPVVVRRQFAPNWN